MMRHILFFLFVSIIVPVKASDILVDRQATERTKILYQNLKDIQKSGKVLFGHQEATSYGRTWVGDKNRSDVKDVTGSHPGVIGLDFANVTTSDSEQFEKAKYELITSVVDTYNRGGISTFAWHASNPANDGSFYWEKDSIEVVPVFFPEENYTINIRNTCNLLLM